ncbi:MAG TPA: hypothetical protein VMK12_03415 [Anaeromyxobacteraceae bacterium]|nr:hypothetical protein [Anaeromyxobacteraceae bacterium]
MLVLAYEWLVPWLRPTSRLSKSDIEALHLHRYATDHRLAIGALPFTAPIAGDRPDFTVTVESAAQRGLDCCALTVQARRGAHALFVTLRRRIVQIDPAAFAHLGGFMLYVWFPGQHGMELPFRSNDEAPIRELLEALASYRPSAGPTTVSSGELPDQLPDLDMVTTPSGAAFYAVPFRNAVPDTVFASIMGFDLGFAFTTEHTPSSAWAELERLVVQHDNPGIDWLLLSVGAPNRDGLIFPTEEALAQFMLEHPSPLASPTHISRITLHLWSTGEAHELLSDVAPSFGPLYMGTIPPHRVIHPATEV